MGYGKMRAEREVRQLQIENTALRKALIELQIKLSNSNHNKVDIGNN